MKTELSHDIIAEKIWDRLPEQDKRLREIERSIQQRTRDFLSGTGDYLGVKELNAWEDALSKFAPESAEYRFIQDSKAFWQAEQEAKERRQREELEKVRQQAAHEKKLREEANHAKSEAEHALAQAEAQRKRAFRLLIFVMGLILAGIAATLFIWSNERDDLLNTASEKSRSKQYQNAIGLWEQAKAFPFYADVQDSIALAKKADKRLRDFNSLKDQGESSFLEGDYLQAKDAFEKANKMGVEDLSDLLRQTEEARRLNLDIFSRKAKIFYDAQAGPEACYYLDKALRLAPGDEDLMAMQNKLNCPKQ